MAQINMKRATSMLAMMMLAFGTVFVTVSMGSARRGKPSNNSGLRDQMIQIPGGRFVVGMKMEELTKLGPQFMIDPRELVIQPSREIDLPTFFIDKYEVTNRQYQRF